MSISWHAEVAFTGTAPIVTDEQQAFLAETIGEFAVVVHNADAVRTTVHLTVDAPTLQQATDRALKTVRQAAAQAIGGRITPVAVRVLSAADYQEEVEAARDDQA